MDAQAVQQMHRPLGLRLLDRLVAAFLLALMAVGSLALWIGVPAACLYLAAKWSETAAEHFVIALPVTLAGMVLFGSLLFWINGIYLRVAGVIRMSADDPQAEKDEEEVRRARRGPLELFLVVSLVIALVAFGIWFFGFAERPCSFSACP
jgi:hypothetical protein